VTGYNEKYHTRIQFLFIFVRDFRCDTEHGLFLLHTKYLTDYP
jgi:hypothetical protein